jgi:uncharacterized protein (DUF433 family)
MIASDSETMDGTPVYRGTRISVELIADMLSQDTSPEEILEDYAALDRERIELAPLYVHAFRAAAVRPPALWQNESESARRCALAV